MTILVLIWTVFMIISEMFHRRKPGTSAGDTKLFEQVQLEIDVLIYYCKYQVKLHSSPWLSDACDAAIAHRSKVFCLQQQIKSSTYNLKFRQVLNYCRNALKGVKLSYPNKTKEPINSQKLIGSCDFGELLIAFSKNINLPHLLYLRDLKCLMLCIKLRSLQKRF